MSLVRCANLYCSNQVRQGLRRGGVDVNGKPLADGRLCSQCRRGEKSHLQKMRRRFPGEKRP